MRRLYLAASGLGLSVAVSFAMANPPLFQEEPASSDAVAIELPAVAEAAAEPIKAADPEAVLREAYLKLMAEKAALMDKTALEAALAAAQQDLRELEGQKLLGEAKAILQRVVDEYPNTRAASEASVLARQRTVPVDLPSNARPL